VVVEVTATDAVAAAVTGAIKEGACEMSIPADFYVEKVRYSKDRTRILTASVRENSGTKLSKAYDMQRDQMLDLLHQGKHFMTIFRNESGKYRRGAVIRMAEVNGRDFIRTDQYQVKYDQLDQLPEY
jgi:hypothetical protein